jgi:hypothetical protein
LNFLIKGSGTDIRVNGIDMMTTSFQNNDWSDDEDSSNSSEEFMYVKGGEDNQAELMLGKFHDLLLDKFKCIYIDTLNNIKLPLNCNAFDIYH